MPAWLLPRRSSSARDRRAARPRRSGTSSLAVLAVELVGKHQAALLVDPEHVPVRGERLAEDQERPLPRRLGRIIGQVDPYRPEPPLDSGATGQPARQAGE